MSSWSHIDRLAEAYAASCLFVDARELETQLSRALADFTQSPLSFDDFTAFLPNGATPKETITRRLAWAGQHIFQQRAWLVAPRLLTKLPQSQFASPLLDQLATLGMTAPAPDQGMPPDLRNAPDDGAPQAPAPVPPTFAPLDALLASPAAGEVWLLKGCSYAQAAQVSPQLQVNGDKSSLFAAAAGDRFLTRLHAPGRHIRALLAARDLVKTSHPDLKVRAAYLILNDPGCSWHFQCHEVTHLPAAAARTPRLLLDDVPVHSTYRDFPAGFSLDGLGLAPLPDFAGGDLLASLPADRPCRALLLLQELWSRQVNCPKRLIAAHGPSLAAQVTRTTGLFLPRDQARHDIEDCLERAHFVRRFPNYPNRFVITPKGIARLLLMKQKLNLTQPLTAATLLTHLHTQATAWSKAPAS